MEVFDRTHKCSLLPATLVTVNVAVYVLLFMAWTFDHDSSLIASGAPSAADAIVDALALPSSFTAWLHRPWTAITYMFTQFSWWHLAGNMIVLYLFAMIADRVAGRSFALTVYLGEDLPRLCSTSYWESWAPPQGCLWGARHQSWP